MARVVQKRHQNTISTDFVIQVPLRFLSESLVPVLRGQNSPLLPCRSQPGPWSAFSESTLQALLFLGQCMHKWGIEKLIRS